MDRQEPLNRVAIALQDWQAREQRLGKLFSVDPAQSRALLAEKLRCYDRIATRFRNTDNSEERMALRVLKQERRQIEKKLYPNFFLRLLRRLFISPIKEQVVVYNDRQAAGRNLASLQVQLERNGLTGLTKQVVQKMDEGHQQFGLSASRYLNDKQRLDRDLSFAKDATGRYRLEGYTATVVIEGKPEETRRHYFSTQQGHEINASEAYNLLMGRAVEKDGKWLQFDLNDRDATGNYRTKEFHATYGYDLGALLKSFPLKGLKNGNEADLMKKLQQGERLEVSFLKEGNERRYFIEANPQHKSVNIYDEHSRKISLSTALGAKTMEAVKIADQEHLKEQEKQPKKQGMRIVK